MAQLLLVVMRQLLVPVTEDFVMTIAPSYLAARAFERPTGNGSFRAGDGGFEALLEVQPGTEGSQPVDPTTNLPLPKDADIKPDPGFTAIFDTPPENSPVDPLGVAGGTSGSADGNPGVDVNEPPVTTTETTGETNQSPKADSVASVQNSGGETNQLPISPTGDTNWLVKPLALETNQLPKNSIADTNNLPKTSGYEITGLLRPAEISQASFDGYATSSSNLRTLLELQETEQR